MNTNSKRWTLGILGVWLLVAAFLDMGTTANLWNNVIVGGLVALVSLMGREKGGWDWAAGLVALWLIVAGFIPAFLSGPGLIWNNLIVGALIATAGFFASSRQTRRPATG